MRMIVRKTPLKVYSNLNSLVLDFLRVHVRAQFSEGNLEWLFEKWNGKPKVTDYFCWTYKIGWKEIHHHPSLSVEWQRELSEILFWRTYRGP